MRIELARELARQGEVRLAALMALATAADMRATAVCGMFGAAAVALASAVLALFAGSQAITCLVVAGGVTAFGLFVAAIIAAVAGAPRNFSIAGGRPDHLREWAWEGGEWRDESEMLEATALRYAKSIQTNAGILEAGSLRMKSAFWVAFASPVCGVLAFLVARLT